MMNAVKNKVVQQCPRCSRQHKVLLYCAKCKSRYCSQCGVGGRCVDCYVKTKGDAEVLEYRKEKVNA